MDECIFSLVRGTRWCYAQILTLPVKLEEIANALMKLGKLIVFAKVMNTSWHLIINPWIFKHTGLTPEYFSISTVSLSLRMWPWTSASGSTMLISSYYHHVGVDVSASPAACQVGREQRLVDTFLLNSYWVHYPLGCSACGFNGKKKKADGSWDIFSHHHMYHS